MPGVDVRLLNEGQLQVAEQKQPIEVAATFGGGAGGGGGGSLNRVYLEAKY